MLKKEVSYEDFNGVTKKETIWFNLTESELTQMTMSEYGTMDERLKAIVDKKDANLIMAQFHDLLRRSYGIKTPDGRFVKKENGKLLFDEFETTGAYDAIFMELITNPDEAANFARGILPKKLQDEAAKNMKSNVTDFPAPVTE